MAAVRRDHDVDRIGRLIPLARPCCERKASRGPYRSLIIAMGARQVYGLHAAADDHLASGKYELKRVLQGVCSAAPATRVGCRCGHVRGRELQRTI